MKLKNLFIVFSLLILSFSSQATKYFELKCHSFKGGTFSLDQNIITLNGITIIDNFKVSLSFEKSASRKFYNIHNDNLRNLYPIAQLAFKSNKKVNVCYRKNDVIGGFELIGLEIND